MAVAVVAGLASTAGAYGTAVALSATFSLAWAGTAFAIGAGLSMISQALQPSLRVGQDTGLSTSVANPIAERPIIYGRTRTGGTIVYFTTSGADNKYLHLVIAVAGHAIDGYEKVYFDDEVIWEDGSYVDNWVQNAQINFYDGTQTTADQDLINASNEWNSNCILNDTAYIHVRLEYDPEVYTNGIPSITTTIRGKQVYDPRTDVTEWSENPALCIYDYLKDPKYGLNDDTVNVEQVKASANVCDQLVTIDTGVDQTRYALSGFISTGDTIKANLEKMLSSMFGKLVCSGGELFVNAGYYTSPVLDINESLLVGAVSLQTKTSRRNVYNAVKGTFLSEEENYIFADYPSIKSDTYSTEDGEPLYLDLPLPCTTNNVRAQRLAKLSLNKSRQQRSLSIPVNLAGLKVRAGDVIRFTSERLGISNAEYEVIDFEFEYSDQLIVNLVCVETGASLYDWTVADKLDFSVGSDITLYDGSAVAPTDLTATAVSNILSDGTDSTYIDVAWTNPSDIYFDYVVLKYGDQSIVTKDQSYRINNVDENTQYTITISAYNTFGRQSTGLSTNVTTVRDTTAPADIVIDTNDTVAGLQSITLNWTNPSDDDFDLVRIKVASDDDEPPSHSYEVRADNFIDDVGAYSATRYYWLAPVDRTGNVGNYVSGGSATTGSIDYSDVLNPPTIPEVATTAYLTLADNDAPTDAEFNTAVGRDPIENDFVVVSYTVETVTNTKAYVYKTVPPAEVPDWTEVTEYIDGSMIVTGSLSASDITTGTLNANDVTISNLTVSYSSQVTDKPTIPTAISQLTNDSGFIDDTNVVFSDDLGDYIRLDSVENLLLSFDKYADQETNIDWTGYSDPTSDIKVVKSADAVTGGSYLEIGNNDGNDEGWLIHNRNIPFDPSQTYRVTVRVKQTAGVGKAYLGFAGVASDGTTFVNYAGNNSFSSQHFFAGANTDIPSVWTEYVGYVKGVGATGTTSQKSDYNDPAVMHQDTRFVRPLILVNYSGASGITLVDSFKIEAISANPNAIQGNEVDANVTEISGGVIQAGSQITVGTGNNIGALSGSDDTFRIWAGHATASSAPFRVSQAGTLYATNAVISGDITAGTINADNITFTGTLTADNLSGIPNVEALNMTQSMRNEIEEIIVTKFGSDASTGYYDEATGSFDAQDDNTQVCKINSFQHNGSNIDIDLTFSKAWQASSGDIPSVEVNIQRAPAGTTTWTTIKTQTVTGSAFYEPELGSWFANIQGYVSVTDNPATGNYDYRFLTGNVLNLSLISLSAKLEANEQGEQIGTIDLADYARIDQNETISGNYTFSGTTSGIDYGDLDNTPTIPDISGKANLSGATFTGVVALQEGEDDGLRVADNKIRSVGDSLIFNSDGIRFGDTLANWDYDEWAGLKYYHPSKTIYFGGARASTSYWENNLGDANDTKIDFVGVTDLSRNGTTFLDSDNNATFNKATISGKIQMEPDDTYTGYYTLGFQGTNTANGVNKIFAHGNGSAGLFICSATGHNIYFRANGGTTNSLEITSGGDIQMSDTTVIDSSRNSYFTSTRLASGNNLEWGGAYSNGYPTIASNSSGASGIMVFYPTGNTDGEIARLDTSGLSVTGDTNISGMIRAGLGTSNSQSTVARFGGASQAGEVNALSLVNSVSPELGNAVSINFHNANIYSPTGKIVTVQRGAGVTDSSIEIYGYNGGLKRQVEIDYLGNFDLQRGGYQVNGTTVIDSSRDITANKFVQSGSIGSQMYALELTRGGTQIWASNLRLGASSSHTGLTVTSSLTTVNQDLNITGSTTLGNITGGDANFNHIGVRNSSNSSGDGISLYGGATGGQPTYGLMFSGTPTYGTHGYVDGDWATYFTMSNTVSRGWIFKRGTTNVASINGYGDAYFGGVVNAQGSLKVGNTTVIDGSRNLTNIGTITSGTIYNSEIYNSGWFRNSNSGQGLYNQANAMHWYSEDDTSYSIYSVKATTKIKFKTEGNVIRGYVYADNASQIGFLNSGGSWTLKCDDSRNVSITNKLGVGGKFQFEPDDTYANYYAIGFQGTNTANGVNKIFAHGTGAGGMFICSASSQSIYFRANGGGTNHFTITSSGNLQMSDTTVIDNSRNMYPTIIDMGSGHAQGYKFHGRSFSWNSAMQSPTTKMPHIWQENYSGWDPVMGIKTTSGFWQMGAYSSNKIHFGYMAGAYGGHSSNSFDTSWAFTPTTFTIGDLGTMNLIVSGNITAYSDRRLKDNIETLDGSKVYQMRGVSFTKDGEQGSGVIAQELEQVAPELVLTNDDDMETKSVAYGNIVGYLIEAIKELKQEIEELKNGNHTN